MNRLIQSIETIAGLFLLLIGILTCVEAGMRYILGMRIPDAYVMATALQGIAIAWGIASTTYTRTHISVDIFWELSSPRLRAAIDIFASFVTFAAIATLMWMMFRKVGLSFNAGEVSNDLLIPLWPIMLVTALGLGAATLLGLLRLLKDILDLRTA